MLKKESIMENKIVYASAADTIVVRFADTTQACREAVRIHDAGGSASDTLCRVLTGAVLGASLMKNDDDLFTLSVNSEGAITYVTATAAPSGDVKALIDFDNENLSETVSKSIGEGTLNIARELGVGEPYRGSIPLYTGEIAEDITAYFAYSEQTPTSCALGEDIETKSDGRAGGFLIQLMPDTTEETITALEQDLAKSRPVCELLEQYEDPKELLTALLPGLKPEVYFEKDVRFNCGCSREKAEQALISAGKDNLNEMISEDRDFPVVCPYCNTKYMFGKDELERLLSEAK